MCLIITGKSSKVRSTLLNTHGLLSDLFTSNPDGIGFMYGTAKGLKITKTLPKNLGDATAFIQRLPQDDREIAIHFRWTTHGKTDSKIFASHGLSVFSFNFVIFLLSQSVWL